MRRSKNFMVGYYVFNKPFLFFLTIRYYQEMIFEPSAPSAQDIMFLFDRAWISSTQMISISALSLSL